MEVRLRLKPPEESLAGMGTDRGSHDRKGDFLLSARTVIKAPWGRMTLLIEHGYPFLHSQHSFHNLPTLSLICT